MWILLNTGLLRLDAAKRRAAEHAIIKRIRRAKLFVFLRQHRHALFADPFQQELADAL